MAIPVGKVAASHTTHSHGQMRVRQAPNGHRIAYVTAADLRVKERMRGSDRLSKAPRRSGWISKMDDMQQNNEKIFRKQ